LNREEKDAIINKMNALLLKPDGSLSDSLMANLWVKKCIEIINQQEE